MRILASVDKNWGIGKDGRLLVNIPEDMSLFRQETLGNVVIMGRKTLESLPNGAALDGRVNIVLTSDLSFERRNVEACHSIDEVLEKVKEYPDKEIYVAGGEMIYRQLLPYCDEADLTMVDYAYDADRHFPNLDEDADWKAVARSEEKTYFNMIYEFVKYRRVGR
jgi:dihydrofolate reductase